VEWTEQEVRDLVSEDKVARTYEIVRKISTAELMRFKVGLDGLKYRPLGKGDSAVGIVSETEKASLLSPDGFHRRQLEAARKAGAQVGVIYVGRKASFKEVSDFLAQWNPQGVAVLAPVPNTDFLLDGVTRAGLKMLLNRLLFEVIEYVEPRMKADQAYPPVVGVSVMRVRHKLGNQEAEKRLMAEL
jgi:hypothetical protein